MTSQCMCAGVSLSSEFIGVCSSGCVLVAWAFFNCNAIGLDCEA